MKKTLARTLAVALKRTQVGAAVFLGLAATADASNLEFMNSMNKSNYYMSLLLSNSDIAGENGIGQDLSVFNATVGYELPRGLSVEARFGVGSDQATSLMQDPVSSYAAAMVRYHYTWSNRLSAYAAAGGAVRAHSDAVSAAATQGGAAFAVGLNLFGNHQTAVNIEYLFMGGEQATSSVGIGFHHYFGRK